MVITLNGKKTELAEGATVSDVARMLRLGETGVAVARNNRVVPRAEWNVSLCENDSLVVINASCGG